MGLDCIPSIPRDFYRVFTKPWLANLFFLYALFAMNSSSLTTSAKTAQCPVRGTRTHAQRLAYLRRMVGWFIVAVGCWAVLQRLWLWVSADAVLLAAFMGGSAAALATGLGTLPVALSQRMSERTQDALYGFGAGVMLAACAFSLILPGMDAVRDQRIFGGTDMAAGLVIGASIILGGLALMGLDKVLPHEHFIKGVEGPRDVALARQLQRTWLFVIAITLHNLPEGLAIGVSYAAQPSVGANALAAGISIQDVPEGLVVAAALLAAGYRRWVAVLIGVGSGLIEPIGAVVGALVVSTTAALLPWGLGFSAGAMLFVISHEIIPESHRKGHETLATAGLLLGFVLMMVLDTALG